MLVMYCNAMQCIAIERINTYNKPVYTNKRENIYIDIFTCLHISKYLCVYIYIYTHIFLHQETLGSQFCVFGFMWHGLNECVFLFVTSFTQLLVYRNHMTLMLEIQPA